MEQEKSSKRSDLQGIRGIAIIVVLGFHFFPDTFPNGYLGVDQFLVLSGFLMCMLLKRAENQSVVSLVSTFYVKRFKRILPLYLLVILLSMIALYNFFPETAVENNKKSAIGALLFVSNRPKTAQEDYFQMLFSAVDIFTHTWSLSLEIQFYFLVPFIYIFKTKVAKKFHNAYYAILGLSSLALYYLSPPTVAFNNMFARVWQFLIGMIVYLMGHDEKITTKSLKIFQEDCTPGEERRQRCMGNISLISLLIITMFPVLLPSSIFRPLITLGTGVLMLVSSKNVLLSVKGLTYIGDISYSLYLIHWPIYAYWKLTCDGDSYLLITALVASCILAVITFETFEKWYLKLSNVHVVALISVLFGLNLIIIDKDAMYVQSGHANNSDPDFVSSEMTIDDALKLNYRWSINDHSNLDSPTCIFDSSSNQNMWCRHSGLPETGQYKMAIIGNSWTANHAKMFYEECGGNAKSILQGAAFGCEALYPSMKKPECMENFTQFAEHLAEEQPDYGFILTRHMTIGDPLSQEPETFDADPIYQIMKAQMLKFISTIKYKLYILDAIPRVQVGVASRVATMMKEGSSPKTIDNALVDTKGYELARKRHAQLVKDCNGKCVLVDYAPEFYNHSSGTFRYFDKNGFSYMTFGNHLSPYGVERIRHIWTRICSNLG